MRGIFETVTPPTTDTAAYTSFTTSPAKNEYVSTYVHFTSLYLLILNSNFIQTLF